MGGGARMARLGRRRGGSAAAGWVGVHGRVWGALSRAVRRGGAGEAFFLVRLDQLGGLPVGPGDVRSGGTRAGADARWSG
jgi:hypothetical protein